MEKRVPNITLPGNISMPIFGLGTLGLDSADTLIAAIEKGYRLIDTAYSYKNQTLIGEVLSKKLQDGILKRDDLFVTTKVPGIFMTSKEMVSTCVQKCLSQLKLAYVDLCLIHAPCAYQYVDDDTIFPKDASGKPLYADCDLVESWKAMECMVDQGLTRAIGVSNFNMEQLKQIVDVARIPVANHQIECHVYLQENAMRGYCMSRGISVTSFGSLGNPGQMNKKGCPVILDDPDVVRISTKHQITPAQVLLAFLIQQGIAVIPKTNTVARLDENMKAVDLRLDEDDMALLRKLDRGYRYYTFKEIFDGHPKYPFGKGTLQSAEQ